MEPPKPFITYSPSEPSKQRLLSSLGLLDRLVFRQTRNGQWEEEQESNRHYEYGSQCASRFEAAMHKTQSFTTIVSAATTELTPARTNMSFFNCLQQRNQTFQR
jgi:hypothetical protein